MVLFTNWTDKTLKTDVDQMSEGNLVFYYDEEERIVLEASPMGYLGSSQERARLCQDKRIFFFYVLMIFWRSTLGPFAIPGILPSR